MSNARITSLTLTARTCLDQAIESTTAAAARCCLEQALDAAGADGAAGTAPRARAALAAIQRELDETRTALAARGW